MRRFFERYGVVDIIMWLIAAAILVAALIGSVKTIQSGKYSPSTWLDLGISGLTQGSIYALIALGYTMVYGVLRMINFAHSEVFMSGSFIGYFAATALSNRGIMNSNPVLALIIVFVVAAGTSMIIALLLERIAYRPLRRAPRLVPLITAIGASLFLQYTFRGLFGSQVRSYPPMPRLEGSITLPGGVQIDYVQIMVIVAAALMMTVLYLFTMRTRAGRALRAVSEDKDVSALMGIDVDATIVRTFLIGGMFAGFAGVLYALIYRQVTFYMGFIPGIKAFTAAVLGGIGNVPGAMLGGLTLGVTESVGTILFLDGYGVPAPYQLKDAISFIVLVLILILRPSGILGERITRAKA
ncbi:MAG TPA: branched-chain amino acid ABC transporter permease [Anaerolineales bacterium]|nr:branched-chain amino acid ABC transporter permease [Anaerolineales bacterium]